MVHTHPPAASPFILGRFGGLRDELAPGRLRRAASFSDLFGGLAIADGVAPGWVTPPALRAATRLSSLTEFPRTLRATGWGPRWCNGLVTRRRQRRWELWIVDRWLSFQPRFPGVSRVRVPPCWGVPRSWSSSWCLYVTARSSPGWGLAGALWRTRRWGKQWGQ